MGFWKRFRYRGFNLSQFHEVPNKFQRISILYGGRGVVQRLQRHFQSFQVVSRGYQRGFCEFQRIEGELHSGFIETSEGFQ